MDSKILDIIKVNRDAQYVNRGFYFQYLSVAKKWVDSYIQGLQPVIYTEFGNDIKEVGDKIMYTQVKCFTKSFSLRSPELVKELYSFFILYLEEKDLFPEIEFQFLTNSGITKSEKLLSRWIHQQPIVDEDLLVQCCKQIKAILGANLKKARKSRLNSTKLSECSIEKIKKSFSLLQCEIEDAGLVKDFTKKISWEFKNQTPQESIDKLIDELSNALGHPKFESKPAPLLLNAILSEIYNCSQQEDPERRKVNYQQMETILKGTEVELLSYANKKIINFLDKRLVSIEERLDKTEIIQSAQQHTLTKHTKQIDSLLANNGLNLKLPKFLSILPYVDIEKVIGFDRKVNVLDNLIVKKKYVCIHGMGGTGKSTLAKTYAYSKQNNYDHILWVDAAEGLVEGFISNKELGILIAFNPNAENSKCFSEILSSLNNITCNGLLIIDGIGEYSEALTKIFGLQSWRILVTSQLRIKNMTLFEVPTLNFASAKKLYRNFEPNIPAGKETFISFFEFVEYNPFIIEMVGRTIQLGFNLSLDKFVVLLNEQQLDDKELDIKINSGTSNLRFIQILQNTFDLTKLTSIERFYLEFFAILPSRGTTLDDLVEWCGPFTVKSNAAEFTNVANALHDKGLVTRIGNEIMMNNLLQESVIYQSRRLGNPFVSNIMMITWLTARLSEGHKHSPTKGFRFLKYGISILGKIKEIYRTSLSRPLLHLENETLNISAWIDRPQNLTAKWQDLASRAEKQLSLGYPLVGTIFNNLGLNLAVTDRIEEAEIYFEKANLVFEKTKLPISEVILTLCNRATIYSEAGNKVAFEATFEKALALRNEHKLWYDYTLPIQCYTMASENMKNEQYESAKLMLTYAINTHQELPDDQRNDLYLINYLCDIGLCYLMLHNKELAEKAAIQATSLLVKLKISKGKLFKQVVSLLKIIAEIDGDKENVKKLESILN